MIHPNSIQGLLTSADLRKKRTDEVVGVLRSRGFPMTDREIATALGYTDLNAVRPRITELKEAGRVEECGTAICGVTHKTVRVVALR